MPATQSSAAAWKMSVPTIFAAVNGNTSSITRPKNVPLPTDVRPTRKPPLAPRATQITRSRFVSRNGAFEGWTPRFTNVLARKPSPPRMSAAPITFAIASPTPSPYCFSIKVATSTPTSDIGPEPRNIQNVMRACTVPSLRCRTAPNDLKTAP